MNVVSPEERVKLQKELQQQLSEGSSIELAMPMLRKDGVTIWTVNRGDILEENGSRYISGAIVNFNQTKHHYDVKKKMLEQYQVILSQTDSVVFEWDYNTDRVQFSDAWERVFGYTPQTGSLSKIIATGEHVYRDDIQTVFNQLKDMREGEAYQIMEIRIARADGEWMWCKVRATGVYDVHQKLSRIIGVIIDIDDEVRVNHALRQQAEQDSLTKICNAHTTRRLAEEYLSQSGDNVHCALLVIDLDDFKSVNDQYGHMFGDEVLVQVAKTIRKQFRSDDIVGRIGGEEFMVLMKDVTVSTKIEERCRQLVEAFHEIKKGELVDGMISCSVGVAVAPVHGVEYGDLFRCADQALYRAKALGKNRYAFYK